MFESSSSTLQPKSSKVQPQKKNSHSKRSQANLGQIASTFQTKAWPKMGKKFGQNEGCIFKQHIHQGFISKFKAKQAQIQAYNAKQLQAQT